MKLTKTFKNTILRKIYVDYDNKNNQAYLEKTHIFADALYEYQYGAYKALLETLPENWTYKTEILWYYIGPKHTASLPSEDYRFIGKCTTQMSHPRRIVCQIEPYINITDNEDLVLKWRSMVAAYHIYNEKEEQVIQVAKQILDSINTLNQLKSIWPEVSKYLPEEYRTKKETKVNSEILKSINERLEL